MNAIDTNVLVYRFDQHEPVKRNKARALLRQLHSMSSPTVLLWQVAGELLRQLRAWEAQGRMSWPVMLRYFAVVQRLYHLVLPTPAIFGHAFDLSRRYSLSRWDSMILGAFVEAGVSTL